MSDQYYDISVRACGFLNRVRRIEPEGRPSYLVASFAALRGPKGQRTEPTYLDLRIVGDQAEKLITQHSNFINDRNRQVFASVRLSDLYVRTFERTKGERQGETGFAIKSRLLVVESLAIDGASVYRRSDDPSSHPSPVPTPPPHTARSANAGG